MTPVTEVESQADVTAVDRGRRGRHRRPPVMALALLAIFVVGAVFADVIAPYEPTKNDLLSRLHAPVGFGGGSVDHLFGTDALGRDVFSRLLKGTQVSLLVAFAAVVVGGTAGSLIGLLSGYVGGWFDALVMRAADASLSFPTILLALVLAVVSGPSLINVIFVICLLLWARYARLVRGEVLSLKSRDFVLLARIGGSSVPRIMLRDLLPNLVSPIVVLATLQVGWAVLVEATLSFLGAGVPPPNPSWGQMVGDGLDFLRSAWWISVLPGITLALFVLAFNVIGDWLRDRFDPRQVL